MQRREKCSTQPTGFVTDTLTASSKVQSFPHSQLCNVIVHLQAAHKSSDPDGPSTCDFDCEVVIVLVHALDDVQINRRLPGRNKQKTSHRVPADYRARLSRCQFVYRIENCTESVKSSNLLSFVFSTLCRGPLATVPVCQNIKQIIILITMIQTGVRPKTIPRIFVIRVGRTPNQLLINLTSLRTSTVAEPQRRHGSELRSLVKSAKWARAVMCPPVRIPQRAAQSSQHVLSMSSATPFMTSLGHWVGAAGLLSVAKSCTFYTRLRLSLVYNDYTLVVLLLLIGDQPQYVLLYPSYS